MITLLHIEVHKIEHYFVVYYDYIVLFQVL